ncbi:30S ribosomal protein S16 [Candidatus Gracilibacteria bacterium]|nr:30S ribosomal protein S16 [Candidatus Gracilibacteria bacterium]MCF7819060.1 30S ribosomal protein S16 [Candidatus Gracilibacteria bacterium]
MLTIRFVRQGRRNQSFFHLVVAEKSQAVQKKYIEKIGYYNPHTEKGKGEFVFDEERIKHYLKNGAGMSQAAARILTKNGVKEAGKFIEERVSKPKKTEPPQTEAPKKEASGEVESPQTEAPKEEAPEQEEEKKSETPPSEKETNTDKEEKKTSEGENKEKEEKKE